MKLHIHCVISFPTPALLSVGAPLVGALSRPPFWPATVQSSSPHARVPTGVKLRIHCVISFSTPTQQPVGAPLVGALSRPPFWPATVQSSVSPYVDTHRSKIAHPLCNFLPHTCSTIRRGTPCGCPGTPQFSPATIQFLSPRARTLTGVKLHIHCSISFSTPTQQPVGAPLVGALAPPILVCDYLTSVSPYVDTHRSKIAHPLCNFLLHTYPTTRRGTPCGCPRFPIPDCTTEQQAKPMKQKRSIIL